MPLENTPSEDARPIGALALAWVVAAALAPPQDLRAQVEEELDAGTYELLIDGEVAGMERFVVLSDGTALRAAARVTSNRPSAALIPGEARLLLDAEFHLDRYELRPSEGPLESVVGLRRGNRLRVQTESEEGERMKEFVAPADLVVLERGFAHHYYLLAGLLRRNAGQRQLSLVVPSEGRQFRATVSDEGEASVPGDGGTATARRFVIEGGGETHIVWAGSDGRVLRVEVPGLGWIARRRP